MLVAKRASAMPDEEDYDGDVDSEQMSDDFEDDPNFVLYEMEEEPADEDFIRELYSRNIEVLDWDDVAF